MEQEQKSPKNQVQNLVPKPEEFTGFSVTNQNQLPSSKDRTVFTNFETTLNQPSQLQTLLIDKFMVKPASKGVYPHYFPVKIINDGEYQFYNISVIHQNTNMQGSSERKLYTKYLGSKLDKNQIDVARWHFYEKNSHLQIKQEKKEEQKMIQKKQIMKKPQEEKIQQLLDFVPGSQDETKLEKKQSRIQKPQGPKNGIQQELVDLQKDMRGTDSFVISFYRKWQKSWLVFTNKPQIRYHQNNKPQQFRQLKFSIKDYFLKPKLVITIKQKEQFSYEAYLQITYTTLQKVYKRKHTTSLISKEVNRQLKSDITYDQKILAQMNKQVHEVTEVNNSQVSFEHQQKLKETILHNIDYDKKSIEDEHLFLYNLQHEQFCFKDYEKQIKPHLKQATRKLVHDDVYLVQANIMKNCYMTASFNQFEQVLPGFLEERGIIMFDQRMQTICVALNINGSKVYIKTDLKLRCIQVKQKNKQPEYRLIYSSLNYIPEETDQLASKKYKRILLYLFVEKCIALYYGNYLNLGYGTPAEIFMMLGDAITYVFQWFEEYKYILYFEGWQNNITQQNKQTQKYLINLSISDINSNYTKDDMNYFDDFFRASSRDVVFNHTFSFAGFYKVGNKKDKKHLIIKMRDYRQNLPEIEKLRQHWIKHKRNEQIYQQLRKIEFKSNEFLINLEDLKILKIAIYVGVISHNYYYSSRQILLEKGKVSHYKLKLQAQTDCQITIHQTKKYHEKPENRNYSEMGIELTLAPEVKLNIFQRHLQKIHISWLKCYLLGVNQYDLKIGLKKPRNNATFQFATFGIKSKNRLDQIQLVSPTLSQNIYCEGVNSYHFQQKDITIALPDQNNYYYFEHLENFVGLELIVCEWQHGECFEQQFDIWMHKLEVGWKDYQKLSQNEVPTIRVHRVGFFKKNEDSGYTLLIYDQKQFKAGFYKIVVCFRKAQKEIKELKMKFLGKQEKDELKIKKYMNEFKPFKQL